MFKSKKKLEPVESPKPEAFARTVTLTKGAAHIDVAPPKLPTPDTFTDSWGATHKLAQFQIPPRAKFSGSLVEAREFADYLNTAIQEAARLEGAVASLYPGK